MCHGRHPSHKNTQSNILQYHCSLKSLLRNLFFPIVPGSRCGAVLHRYKLHFNHHAPERLVLPPHIHHSTSPQCMQVHLFLLCWILVLKSFTCYKVTTCDLKPSVCPCFKMQTSSFKVPPEITAQCSDRGITFSVVRPPRAQSLWEVGVDHEPLTSQLATQRGYLLYNDTQRTTLEVPVFSIGYNYEVRLHDAWERSSTLYSVRRDTNLA